MEGVYLIVAAYYNRIRKNLVKIMAGNNGASSIYIIVIHKRTTFFASNHIPHLTNIIIIIIDILLSTNVDYQISIIYQAKQPSARPRHVITIYIHALAFHFNTQTTILAAERKKNEEEESEVELSNVY